MEEYDIAIVGGGPSGIMAAIAIPDTLKVVILEKNDSLGKKLLLTGGGRCNITNLKPVKKLLNVYDNKNFLKHSFYTLTNEKLLDFFKVKGLDFIEEDNNRIFPKTQCAGDVLDILESYLVNVDIKYNYNVTSITEGFVINNDIKSKKVIIATGDDFSLVNQPLTPVKYGLVPLICENDLTSIAGITLYNVKIKYRKIKTQGNVLISHVGLTGPAIIDLSNEISKSTDYNILSSHDIKLNEVISLDLCPDFSYEYLNDKFLKEFRGKSLLKNYLRKFLINNFIEFFLDEINIPANIQLSQISKKNKNKLIKNLKAFEFKIIEFNSKLSKITIGGVDLDYVNSKTLESTLTPDLYFAGEVLNLHGPTGGYNLKIAFSTGYLAGISAAEKQ